MEDLIRVEDLSEDLNCCLFAVSKTYLTMKDIEQALPKTTFARIHRSFIVNMNYVRVIERNQLKLESGEYLTMGDNYKNRFLAIMDEHLVKTNRVS
jgi:DNA-binding LytR/AlgR family response regulator